MRSASSAPTTRTRGVVFIHSAPSALCPHLEWAIIGILDASLDVQWVPQPAEAGTYRTEISWEATVGTAANIASTLRGWDRLRFEVAEEPTATSEGARYSYTPDLGIFHAMTGLHGDVLIPEDRIRAAMVRASKGEVSLDDGLDALLGAEWDAELEPFRHAGDGAPVRWLHQVI